MSNELPLIAVIAKRLFDLQASFRTLSKQEGPRGPQGLPGKDGQDGKDGKDGIDGKDGRDGIDGEDGAKGEKGDPPAHKWDGTKLSFQQPDGSWGKKVDLRGPKGEVGSGKVIVASSGSDGTAVLQSSGHPGKTLVWEQGVLSEVLLYRDTAKTQLAERRILNRTGQTLTSVVFRDGNDAITKTRTLGYTSGVLTSVTEA